MTAFRSRKLLDSAEGKPCAFCLQNDGTTIPAHLNSVALGKGTGIKCSDAIHARACHTCHSLYDGRVPGWSPAERFERFAWAYFRTVKAWFDEGIVRLS